MEIIFAILSAKYNKFKWYAIVGLVVLMFLAAEVATAGFYAISPQYPAVYLLLMILTHLAVSAGFFFFSRFIYFRRKEKVFIERDDPYIVFEPDERQQMKTAKGLFPSFWGIVVLGILIRFVLNVIILVRG